MVIVKLKGGLGNQMFQYAVGRSLADRVGSELKLDTSFLEATNEKHTPRTYELGRFRISADIASEADVIEVLGERTVYNNLRAKVRKWLRFRWELPRLYREPCYHYDTNFERLTDNTYLSGYWHSERYFASIVHLLKDEFTLREPLKRHNQEVARAIVATESVSVHVRRGDYLTDPKTNHFHGVCDLDYYRRAVLEISQRLESPYFYVFSDDHAWVKEHLVFEWPTTFVDCNGPETGYKDLRLMSLCRHNIIANSSFSWWGAWLNQSPDKIVIAPRQWFKNAALDTKDLLPCSWMKI